MRNSEHRHAHSQIRYACCYEEYTLDDAIKQADIFSPQILLMDYQLGNGVNGLDLIEAIRQHLDVVLPASLVTATHDEDLVTRCKEQGVNYLSKPLKPAKLRALLKSMTRHVKPVR